MVPFAFTEILGATHRASGKRTAWAPMDQIKNPAKPIVVEYPTVPTTPAPPYQDAISVPTTSDQGRARFAL